MALILYHSDFKDAAHLPVQQKRLFFFSCFHFTALKSQLCRAVRLVRQPTLPMLWAFTFHGTDYLVTFSCCISREIFMGNARCILFHLVVVKSTVSLNKSLSPPQHCPAMLKQKSGQLQIQRMFALHREIFHFHTFTSGTNVFQKYFLDSRDEGTRKAVPDRA